MESLELIYPFLKVVAQFFSAIAGCVSACFLAGGIKFLLSERGMVHFLGSFRAENRKAFLLSLTVALVVLTILLFFLGLERKATGGGMWAFGGFFVLTLAVWTAVYLWKALRWFGIPVIAIAAGFAILVLSVPMYNMLEEFNVAQSWAYTIEFVLLAAFNPVTVWVVQQIAKEEEDG